MADVEVYGKMLSTLPDDDDHPYRSGAWRPQNVEYDADDLRVEGELPGDLYGVYLRNTENPLLNDMPLFWEPDLIARGLYAARYHPELPSRLGVIPRRGGTGERNEGRILPLEARLELG